MRSFKQKDEGWQEGLDARRGRLQSDRPESWGSNAANAACGTVETKELLLVDPDGSRRATSRGQELERPNARRPRTSATEPPIQVAGFEPSRVPKYHAASGSVELGSTSSPMRIPSRSLTLRAMWDVTPKRVIHWSGPPGVARPEHRADTNVEAQRPVEQ